MVGHALSPLNPALSPSAVLLAPVAVRTQCFKEIEKNENAKSQNHETGPTKYMKSIVKPGISQN